MKLPTTNTIPINPGDLRALNDVLRGYLAYLRGGVPPSKKRESDIRALQSVQERLARLLASSWQGEEICLPFTVQELQAMKEATAGFMNLLCCMIPPSQERNEVMTGLAKLHQCFAEMLSAYFN